MDSLALEMKLYALKASIAASQTGRYDGKEKRAAHTYRRKTLQPNDFRVIAALKVRGADKEFLPIQQKDIAAMVRIKQSKVSKALDRLTALGFVKRVRFGIKADAIKLVVYYEYWNDRIIRDVLHM